MPIEYQLYGKSPVCKETLKNVSKGGLCFLARARLDTGDRLHVSIPLEDRTYEADGIVVWCRAAECGYRVGVKFEVETSAYTMRMVEQLCHIEQYRRSIRSQEGRELSSDEAAAEWVTRFAAEFPRIN